MSKLYSFCEHSLTVTGEKSDLLELVDYLEHTDISNTWADLVFKIKSELDTSFRQETGEMPQGYGA